MRQRWSLRLKRGSCLVRDAQRERTFVLVPASVSYAPTMQGMLSLLQEAHRRHEGQLPAANLAPYHYPRSREAPGARRAYTALRAAWPRPQSPWGSATRIHSYPVGLWQAELH